MYYVATGRGAIEKAGMIPGGSDLMAMTMALETFPNLYLSSRSCDAGNAVTYSVCFLAEVSDCAFVALTPDGDKLTMSLDAASPRGAELSKLVGGPEAKKLMQQFLSQKLRLQAQDLGYDCVVDTLNSGVSRVVLRPRNGSDPENSKEILVEEDSVRFIHEDFLVDLVQPVAAVHSMTFAGQVSPAENATGWLLQIADEFVSKITPPPAVAPVYERRARAEATLRKSIIWSLRRLDSPPFIKKVVQPVQWACKCGYTAVVDVRSASTVHLAVIGFDQNGRVVRGRTTRVDPGKESSFQCERCAEPVVIGGKVCRTDDELTAGLFSLQSVQELV